MGQGCDYPGVNRRARTTLLDRIVDTAARVGYLVTIAALLVVVTAVTAQGADADAADVVTFELGHR